MKKQEVMNQANEVVKAVRENKELRKPLPRVKKTARIVAVMDEHTCMDCKQLDKHPIGIDAIPPVKECTSESGCRCVVEVENE